MNRNPYTPPTARVADPPATAPPTPRPPQVGVAVALLLISIVVGVPMLVRETLAETDSAAVAIGVSALAVVYALYGYLVVQIHRGHNWARIVWLVLFAISLAALVFMPYDGDAAPSDLKRGLDILTLLLEFIALVLLFIRPGSKWFARREKSH
jgi:drug/metabolite transporter (DMT)-like permease